MPFTYVFAIICLVVAVIGFAVWAFVPYADSSREDKKLFNNPFAFFTGAGGIVLFLIFLVIASMNIVGTRQVGIVIGFNKPTGETLSSGLHWLAPWKQVVEMDAAIQNDVYNGDRRIQVRLGNNSTALADANVRWNIKVDEADELYQQYKTFDNVKSNLVERNLRTALNEAFTKFDPLSNDTSKSNLNTVTAEALRLLREKSGAQVEIIDLSIPVIDYDDKTEERINAINQSRAQTTQAEQDALTAEQRRKAAEVLAGQPVPDLKIAIAACVNRMAETGQNLNCFPIGTNVVPTLAVPNPAG